MYGRIARNILRRHFHVDPKQKVILLTDDEKHLLAEALKDELTERGARPLLLILRADQERLSESTVRQLTTPGRGLIVLLSPQTWMALDMAAFFNSRMRPTLESPCAPVFFDEVMPLESVVRVFSSDPEDDREYLQSIFEELEEGGRTRVTAPGGTDLSFMARDWRFEGRELLTSPHETSVNGVIVADLSTFFSTLTEPISLHIKDGRLAKIASQNDSDPVYRKYREWMQEQRERDEADWQLAEVGIGGNARAQISGCIMEDESVRGTCHFCFGDNTRYGGDNYSDWHGGTVVVRHPEFSTGFEFFAKK